jgi:hypothetical protein
MGRRSGQNVDLNGERMDKANGSGREEQWERNKNGVWGEKMGELA